MDCRNDIPMLIPSDNSYECAEHCLNFHKFGSRRLGLNFVCEAHSVEMIFGLVVTNYESFLTGALR